MRKRASPVLRHARVERELYRSEGFRVLEVDLEGERARLVGELEAYPEGTWLRGEFEAFEHPRHGRTYRARRLEVAPPPPP
ncbi:YrrC family ATP-dependent DNA helicase, partial [Calidithermus roseus]|uniref:YrrC family ATP-dependent DNA helicase n=1 Tax=Calidithermus roseus TaxID=1644118 RepID=UPI003B835264